MSYNFKDIDIQSGTIDEIKEYTFDNITTLNKLSSEISRLRLAQAETLIEAEKSINEQNSIENKIANSTEEENPLLEEIT